MSRFQRVYDPNTKRYFYHNKLSGEVSWTKPHIMKVCKNFSRDSYFCTVSRLLLVHRINIIHSCSLNNLSIHDYTAVYSSSPQKIFLYFGLYQKIKKTTGSGGVASWSFVVKSLLRRMKLFLFCSDFFELFVHEGLYYVFWHADLKRHSACFVHFTNEKLSVAL